MSQRWDRWSRNLFRTLTVVALAAGTWLAVVPVEEVPVPQWDDKLMHMLAFALLAGFADLGWLNGPYLVRALPLLGYGAVIELIQYSLPHRSFELADLAADGLGLLLYAALVPVVRRLPWLRRRWGG